MLKILEVTDEEFDEKRKKNILSYNYTEINLQSWLSAIAVLLRRI